MKCSPLPPSLLPSRRDLHKAHPTLEQKVWIMETHATRSPVPGDPDTYNHWMSDEDILKMARVVRREGGREGGREGARY